ncbi:hypothetical protein HYH03_008619 [Edaphochlamys debaryana]|uniref:Dihydroxyacetone kinase n=1 Tax=Edaphochlamys debaryana TaxID=47281 RepID=A0A835Y0S0_9CHLO|nr:hypothetical protein HYH03_008619 [Edaphochlamys debaryana]|eukprot:KAG2493199.1 hypothetical protein HYH03_008619 [Edaphochlamys debaryana]
MTNAKKLLNSPETIVTDALHGLCLTHAHLQRLDGFPQIKVIINRDHDKSKVAVISGGGSGHEPAHAGYVGEGMLAAAVCGDVFASPSTEAVLAAIRAVTGPGGCLLVVKNYTGDRLNFGQAAERALSEGLRVEVVVVGEDTAIEAPSPLTGRRGLAGTVLVHKAAGAAAARGAPLSVVAATARRVCGCMGTLGAGLTVCTLPGKATSDRLGPDQLELGLGIHGEPGRAVEAPLPPAGDLVGRMAARVAEGMGLRQGSPRVVLLVNGLGGTPPLELALAGGEAITAARRGLGAVVDRVFVGNFMTSLDMAGVSLTLLSYNTDEGEAGAESEAGGEGAPAWEELLALLDAPTAAPGWPYRAPAIPGPHDPETLADIPAPLPAGTSDAIDVPPPPPPPEAPPPPPPPPKEDDGSSSSSDDDDKKKTESREPAAEVAAPPEDPNARRSAVLAAALRAAAEALVAAAPELDALDAQVGDGDCGSTLGGGAAAVLSALGAGGVATWAPAAAMQQVAACVRSAVGGSSGVLYDILITAAARQLKSDADVYGASLREWTDALSAGLAAVQKYGRADRGCRTMLDALLPARDALLAAVEEGKSAAEAAEAAAAAAEAGADSTRWMAATAGRASYVPAEVLARCADPGALAAAKWVRAAAEAVKSG